MKKKINNPGTTDLFFEQLENTMHIESKGAVSKWLKF